MGDTQKTRGLAHSSERNARFGFGLIETDVES